MIAEPMVHLDGEEPEPMKAGFVNWTIAKIICQAAQTKNAKKDDEELDKSL